jgi:hypothetical protein
VAKKDNLRKFFSQTNKMTQQQREENAQKIANVE